MPTFKTSVADKPKPGEILEMSILGRHGGIPEIPQTETVTDIRTNLEFVRFGNNNLFPQALQAINQLENAILPAGLPRPAAMLLQASNGIAAAMNGNGQAETRAPTPSTAGIPADRRSPGTEGLNGVSQRTRARGVQLV